MKFVTVRELKINGSKVINSLKDGDVVITKNGKPTAALLPLDEDLLEEFIIAHHPKLVSEVDKARLEYERKGGLDHRAMKEKIRRRRG
jgi:prevent-host-death family protein